MGFFLLLNSSDITTVRFVVFVYTLGRAIVIRWIVIVYDIFGNVLRFFRLSCFTNFFRFRRRLNCIHIDDHNKYESSNASTVTYKYTNN